MNLWNYNFYHLFSSSSALEISICIFLQKFCLFIIARYLGDQRYSYNQFLSFDLRTGEEGGRASVIDIVLEGSGQRVSSAIFTQGNKMPSIESNNFKFRLHEHKNYQWTPPINSQDFMTILSNLTAIKIRATYNNEGKLNFKQISQAIFSHAQLNWFFWLLEVNILSVFSTI